MTSTQRQGDGKTAEQADPLLRPRGAAARLGITLFWRGRGVEEEGVVATLKGPDAPALKVGTPIVKVDPRYFRPAEVDALLGDPTKAKATLGWGPEITLDSMIDEMVAHDLNRARRNALLQQHGYKLQKTQDFIQVFDT